jgi:hypothetical protein
MTAIPAIIEKKRQQQVAPKNIEVHASGDIVLTFADNESVILTDVEVGRRGPGADRLAQIACALWPALNKADVLEWIKLAGYPANGSAELFTASGLPHTTIS